MACTPCFTKRIDNCAESVTIDGQLLPNTVYTWVITDRFGHEWSYNITTDADGSFEIDLTDPMFPAGLFNQFAALTLQVFLYADRCEPATMIFCDTEYNCLTFSVGAGNYTYIEQNRPDEVLTCCFEEILYADIADLILNNGITEGMLYRITDATEYDINLIVTGLNTSSVSGLAYSEEFPQDEIFYDIDNDVITRRTDTIKKLSAPFDWRNKMHELTIRTFNASALTFPCTPVSYSYDGSPITVASPDSTTAGMVFNNYSDVLVWLQSVLGGMACRVNGGGAMTEHLLSLYNLSTFDPLFTTFTLNDGTNKVISFTDTTDDFYTFGNTIYADNGSGAADVVTPAANGNGGNCINIWVNDYQITAVPTVIGDSVRDVRCGSAIINDGAYNIQINYESDKSYFFNYNGGGNNIIADIGNMYQNSAYGISVASNIVASVLGCSLTGFEQYKFGDTVLTFRRATERTDNFLGLYDYRNGISIQAKSTFEIPFTQTVDRITEESTAQGFANMPEIMLKPTDANTLTLTNTPIGSLANAGEIICEDGPITLDGSNGDYAILRPVTLQAYPGLSFWQVTEYHNFA